MTVGIRLAGQDDIPAIRKILIATWHATYDAVIGADQVTEITDRWHSINNLTQELQDASQNASKQVFLVAERDGSLVGTASASLCSQTCLELNRLYVKPEWQGQGIGYDLLADVVVRFPIAKTIRLEVEPHNTRAIDFYCRRGLRVVSSGDACGSDKDAGVSHLIMDGALPLTLIRPVHNADAQDLFGLLALCFAEYPGCYVDPHEDLPDLIAPASAIVGRSGAFWVIEDARGRVAACCAVDFPETGLAEVHRLYVRPDMRRKGLARCFMDKAETFAIEQGATTITLWSDTRFVTAHAFYRARGYRQGDEPRILNDISHSLEYVFDKQLTPG